MGKTSTKDGRDSPYFFLKPSTSLVEEDKDIFVRKHVDNKYVNDIYSFICLFVPEFFLQIFYNNQS